MVVVAIIQSSSVGRVEVATPNFDPGSRSSELVSARFQVHQSEASSRSRDFRERVNAWRYFPISASDAM